MNQEEIKRYYRIVTICCLLKRQKNRRCYLKGKIYNQGRRVLFTGTFSGQSCCSGCYSLRMMGQSACCLLAGKVEGCTPFFTKMNNVKFKNQVKPGDTLESVCTLTKSKGVFYFIDAKGYVDGKLCVSAELSFALIPNNK